MIEIKNFLKKNKVITFIVILALILRIVFLFASPVKWWDETIYANLGYDLSENPFHYSFDGKWSDFVPGGEWPRAGFRAPLLPYIIAGLYFLKISFIISFLIPIISALSVLSIYLFGKKLFNEKVGIYAAIFLALNPMHIYYGSKILTDVLFTFLILLTFIFFWKGYGEGNNKFKILFGFLFALSLLSRYTALWFIPVFFFYLLIRNKSLAFLKDKYLWYAILLFFVTLLPWFFYSYFEYGSFFGALIHGSNAASYWGGVQPWNFFFSYHWRIFSILGIFFAFSLFWIGFKKEFYRREIYILLIWIFVYLAMLIIMPHKEDRYILPIIPPVCLLCAFFISKFKRIFFILLALVLLVSAGFLFVDTMKTSNNVNAKCFMEVIDYLNSQDKPFLIVSENPPIIYYYTKEDSTYYPNPINIENLKFFSNKDEKVYFVFTRYNSGLADEEWRALKEILKENYGQVFNCSLDPDVNFVYSS